MLVIDDFEESVSSRPDQLAIADHEVRLTWAELATLTNHARAWLAFRDVRLGDRLVYAGVPDHRMVVWFWATLASGAVFVPLHEELNGEQLQFSAANCGARIVICDAAETLDLPTAQCLTPTQAWDGVLACADAPRPDSLQVTPDDLALLIYTSGTTGRPRGVMCPHRQVHAATDAICTALGYRSDDVVLCRLPLAFDYGLYQLLLAARAGCAVVLASRTSDFKLLDTLTDNGVTVVPLVPSLAQMLTLLQRRRSLITQVRLFTNTGARLRPSVMADLLEHFPGAAYASMYGMTECKRISILPPAEYAAHPESVGYAIDGDRILIENADGQEAAPGTVGEIVVRGATVMAGYWGIDPQDQDRYRRGPEGVELHTGDRGFLDTDGRLYFVGRSDDLIKRHGVRMSLHEVEDAADACPGVDASVALKPASDDGPLILCYAGSAPENAVTCHLLTVLDRVRRPTTIRRIRNIPLTRNGKPDRAALAAQLIRPPTTEEVHHAATRV